MLSHGEKNNTLSLLRLIIFVGAARKCINVSIILSGKLPGWETPFLFNYDWRPSSGTSAGLAGNDRHNWRGNRVDARSISE
jgi:hypothetical protein